MLWLNKYIGVVIMNLGPKIVLIVGSAPDATRISSWDLSHFASCVVINNAWRLTRHWDYLIFPEDFPVSNFPSYPIQVEKQLITACEFVPEQNKFGGFIYAGGTMAFTAGYWALGSLKPDVIAYLGCDMVYTQEEGKSSHFYGNGSADPLRQDITLQSLEAKSVRLMIHAQLQNCAIVNLSKLPHSRLLFPRASTSQIISKAFIKEVLEKHINEIDPEKIKIAFQAEKKLSYMVSSGRYWESIDEFDKDKLKQIDSYWLESAAQLTRNTPNDLSYA